MKKRIFVLTFAIIMSLVFASGTAYAADTFDTSEDSFYYAADTFDTNEDSSYYAADTFDTSEGGSYEVHTATDQNTNVKDVYIDNTVDNSISYVTGSILLNGSGGEEAGYDTTKEVYSESAKVTYSNPRTSEVQELIDAAYAQVSQMAQDIKAKGKSGEINITTSSLTGKVWDNRKYTTIEDEDAVLIGDVDYLTGAYGINDQYTRTHIASGDYGKETFYRVEAKGWVSGFDINVKKTGNGTVSVDHTTALKDAKIKVSIQADKGWVIDTVGVFDSNKHQISATVYGNTGMTEDSKTFTMPAADVEIVVDFKNTSSPEVKPTSVKLNKTSATMEIKDTLQLNATISPTNATNKAVTWKSSNTSIATVDSNGKVTAKKAGSATITVTTKDGNKTATCKITVKETPTSTTKKQEQTSGKATVAVTGIKVSPTSSTLATKKTLQLKATITPSSATNKGVTWTSSDKNTATVDANGKITALRYGTVTITATSKANSKIKATCKISTRYYDVNDSSKYYYKPVYWAAEKSITRGYDNVYFGPQQTCERKDYIIFLYRLAGRPAVSGKTSFTDVEGIYKKGTDTYNAILWGYQKGIIKGFDAKTFGPKKPVNRKDAMIMLYRYARSVKKITANAKTSKFSDVQGKYKTSSDTFKAIVWGTENGITNGYSSGQYKGQFGTTLPCLREHIVTFLYRYSKK